MRSRLQGVANVLRFNWPMYAIALGLASLLFLASAVTSSAISVVFLLLAALALTLPIVSLIASWYIYDHSSVYSLSWLDRLNIQDGISIVSVCAGFDEVSSPVRLKFPKSDVTVLDFYDPGLHTEPSIRRARVAYPPSSDIIRVTTDQIPLEKNSTDLIIVAFSAHEIRDSAERIRFFRELKTVIKETGHIVVLEHLRNAANLIVYNMGAFHFYSDKEWLRTFDKSGLIVDSSNRITPFLRTYILKKNGDSS